MFKTKLTADGKVETLKTRLVARGFEKRYEIHYQDTFANKKIWPTIRFVVITATRRRWSIKASRHQDKVSQRHMEEEVHMELPSSRDGVHSLIKVMLLVQRSFLISLLARKF